MEIFFTYESADNTQRCFAEQLALSCNIPAHLKGFDFLVDCALIYANKPLSDARLYSLVGAAHGISAHSASRDISYAINKADGLHSKLSELTGAHIPRTDIHNGFVIAVFARFIRRNAFLNSPD